VLQRFERRLEGLVEGAFARVFGGVVQPVEVAAALQREAADNKQIVGQGRVLVPNAFVVEMGSSDLARFAEWEQALRDELAAMVGDSAREQGWSFIGQVTVLFEQVDELGVGVFRVRSSVATGATPSPAHLTAPSHPTGPARLTGAEQPRLVVTGPPERVVPLDREVVVVGRGVEADLRLSDTGVSRSHAELRTAASGAVRVVDLGSTNGTLVNGQRVDDAVLVDGDRLVIGATAMVFRTASR